MKKRMICILMAFLLLFSLTPVAQAEETLYTPVLLTMSSNLTNQDHIGGLYAENTFYITLDDLCSISGFTLIQQSEDSITLGSASTEEDSLRLFKISIPEQKMEETLFSTSYTIDLPTIQYSGTIYLSALHFLNYIGANYSLTPDGDPQFVCIKRYDVLDALEDYVACDQGYFFSWDEISFHHGSVEDNLTWQGVLALISQDSSIPRMVLDAEGIYEEDLEEDLLMVVTNEGTDWLKDNPSTSEVISLVDDGYGLAFDWFQFIKDLYAPEASGTLGDVLDAISGTGDFLSLTGSFTVNTAQAVDTMVQYSNLTDIQKNLLQTTLISHYEDSALITEEDFWEIMVRAAENVDQKMQSEISAQYETSLDAITSIAYDVNDGINGGSTILSGNPVLLAWDSMTWLLRLSPVSDQATQIHNAYNCSMIQQASNELLVQAFSDLYYHNFYLEDEEAQNAGLIYLKNSLILQLKATLSTREAIMDSGAIEGTSYMEAQCEQIAALLNQVEGCQLNGPNRFSPAYSDDLSWMASAQPDPEEIYGYALSKLEQQASFTVVKQGTMHAGFVGHQDVNFVEEMDITDFGGEAMSATGSYRQTGGSYAPNELVFAFTYAYPDITKTYSSPYVSEYTMPDTLLDLTLPLGAHSTRVTSQRREDGSTLCTFEYDGQLMNQNTCGLLDDILPDEYRVYWSPNEYYADQDGIISGTVNALIDDHFEFVSIEVSYEVNGGIQDFTRLSGTTTFTFE